MDTHPQVAPQRPRRLSTQAFLADVGDELFSLDRGLPWTLWQLLRRPGPTIGRYLEWRDDRLTKPLRLLLIVIASCALILHALGSGAFLTGVQEGMDSADPTAGAHALGVATGQTAVQLLAEHFNLIIVLVFVPATAASLLRVFPRDRLNVAEALCFGLYTLTCACLWMLLPAVWLAFMGPLPLLVIAACWLWPVAHAAYGFHAGTGAIARALGCTLLAAFLQILLLIATTLALAAWVRVRA